ncbi:MAG: nucleoside phosphorylase [Desulfobacteraceae bacterium]|nr:nucleoside phosphorylase [Desulfobacteraceae bacterium]
MSYPTLSALNSKSLIPVPGGRKSSSFGKVAVLVSSDQDFKNIRSNSLKPKSSNLYLSSLFTDKNEVSFAGPYIGAPYGVVLLESLIAKGASKILVLGWCGAVSDKLKAGDLIIPTGAISDEGTSRNYVDGNHAEGNHAEGNYDDFPVINPSAPLSIALEKKLDTMELKSTQEKIWTTDAIYRETPEKVEFFREKGAFAVEMECSALFAAAHFRNVEISALLVVSDEIKCSETVKEWIPGFRSKEFKEARKKACKAIAEFANELNTITNE